MAWHGMTWRGIGRRLYQGARYLHAMLSKLFGGPKESHSLGTTCIYVCWQLVSVENPLQHLRNKSHIAANAHIHYDTKGRAAARPGRGLQDCRIGLRRRSPPLSLPFAAGSEPPHCTKHGQLSAALMQWHTVARSQFMEWAKKVCKTLEDQGYWSDFIDPCSGLAVRPQRRHQVLL
eukprot:366438-Chlamydomonas_euryale.AAC.12